MICTFCKKEFERSYRRSAARKARPQYCSKRCVQHHRSAITKETFASRFWTRVKPANANGCREWGGRVMKERLYGMVDLDGRPQLAHRIAYRLATGVEPGELSVCHSCDNPPCCEPTHLWLGTHQENMTDMSEKGRTNPTSFPGEKHPNSKLEAADVLAIRKSKSPTKTLADRYSTTPQNIRGIKNYVTWKHI